MISHPITAKILPSRALVNVTLEYKKLTPFEVQMHFQITATSWRSWLFCRELLAHGIQDPAGVGDVQVCPHPWDDNLTTVTLRSPDGTAVFEFRRGDLVNFLEETFLQVAPGQEPKRYGDGWNADAEWMKWVTQ